MSDMELTDDEKHREGQWISIRVRVAEQGSTTPFPEEIKVMARSHNQDIVLPVLREHVIGHTSAPKGWPRCSSMVVRDDGPAEVYIRCTRDDGHAGDHETLTRTWTDKDEQGNIEDV